MRYTKLHSNKELCITLNNYAISTNFWQTKHSFDHIIVPLELISNDSVLSYLIQNFEVYAVIFKMNPYEFHRFHVDARRKCAVNMLLSGFDSHCYFGENNNEFTLFTKIEELIYESDTFYLFNTLALHTVLNLSETRYLFSLGIYNQNYDFISNSLQIR